MNRYRLSGGASKAGPSLLLYVNVNWIHGPLHLSDSWVDKNIRKASAKASSQAESKFVNWDDNEFSPM